MTAPSSNEWNTLVITYAVCYLILYLKYVVVLTITADAGHHPKEDEKYLIFDKLEGDHGNRLKRILGNDMENLPMQGVIFWGALVIQIFQNASGNGKTETFALTALVIIYTASRVLHTVFYYFAVQPYRSLMFMIALFATFSTCGLMINSANGIDFDKVFPSK